MLEACDALAAFSALTGPFDTAQSVVIPHRSSTVMHTVCKARSVSFPMKFLRALRFKSPCNT